MCKSNFLVASDSTHRDDNKNSNNGNSKLARRSRRLAPDVRPSSIRATAAIAAECRLCVNRHDYNCHGANLSTSTCKLTTRAAPKTWCHYQGWGNVAASHVMERIAARSLDIVRSVPWSGASQTRQQESTTNQLHTDSEASQIKSTKQRTS